MAQGDETILTWTTTPHIGRSNKLPHSLRIAKAIIILTPGRTRIQGGILTRGVIQIQGGTPIQGGIQIRGPLIAVGGILEGGMGAVVTKLR